MNTKFDLDERLIQFAALAIETAVALPSSFASNHLANQLIRSGTSPALNYAEAQGAESRKDLIHKMKVSLKELRETYCCLRIIKKMNWVDEDKITRMINENNQLISIFVKSIQTAKINNSNSKPNK